MRFGAVAGGKSAQPEALDPGMESRMNCYLDFVSARRALNARRSARNRARRFVSLGFS